MKTPMQELIERFEIGAKMHQQQMNEKDLSPTEKNRQSYLYGHCKAVITIATELLEKEKQTIINAYNKSGKKSTTIANNLIHASTGVKDTFYHEDAEGEKYFNETFNKQTQLK